MGIATVVGASTLAVVIGFSQLTWLLTGILTAVVIGAFGWLMSCQDYVGVRALEKVLGFEEFFEPGGKRPDRAAGNAAGAI